MTAGTAGGVIVWENARASIGAATDETTAATGVADPPAQHRIVDPIRYTEARDVDLADTVVLVEQPVIGLSEPFPGCSPGVACESGGAVVVRPG